MILNYLHVGLRNIARHRVYFLVGVASLSIGIVTALFVYAYVANERSFDRFHSKGKNIVRVNSKFTEETIRRVSSRTPFPLKAVLVESFPEVELVARFGAIASSRAILNYNGYISFEDISFADPEFLKVFDFKLVKGDMNHALDHPNSVILTERTASKYFRDDDPIGKTLRYQGRADLTVTGIMQDTPVNSHIRFDVLLPIEFQRIDWRIPQNNFYDSEQDWLWNGSWTYVLLREGADADEFESRIAELPKKYYSDQNRQSYRYEVQRLSDVHFSDKVTAQPTPPSSSAQIAVVALIGILILIIATINFTNLSTAQAPVRSKEVGLRKTFGARKSQIIFQSLSETSLVVLMAMFIGIVVVQAAFPVFSRIVGRELTLVFDRQLIAWIGVGGAVITILAGLYPAIIISRPNLSRALKGDVAKERYSMFSLRNGLVVFQLTVSIALISGMFIIRDQMDFIRNKDLGFDKSKIVTIRNGNSFDNFGAFKEKLLGVSGIDDVYRGYFPGQAGWTVTWTVEGKVQPVTMPVQMVDDNFVSMFGMRMIAGRDFIRGNRADTAYALINRKMARDMGWSDEEALGRKLSYIGGNDNKTLIERRVVGVVQDANLESLYKPVQAMVFQLSPWGDVAVKINGRIDEMLRIIEQTYKETAPGRPFEYNFLDADINSLYTREEKLARVVQGFGILAIVISCSGLLALCSFVTRQRTKEVAIRKVHGASIFEISILLGRYFLTLGLVSAAIAIPVIYYFSNEWLSTFAFSTRPGVGLGIKTVIALVVLIFAGVSYHIARVSRTNAAVILKSE
jgi:putative ABC transport system permease protein